MPHISSLPRVSRNLYAYGHFLLRWNSTRRFRWMLANSATRFDVVHFNHEGLFLLARWLRRRLAVRRPGLTMHIRTWLPSTIFSRWQFRTIAAAADRLVFITENERDRAQQLATRALKGSVIYNAVKEPSDAVLPRQDLMSDPRFKVAALGNYAYIRGLDRLIDVAAEIKTRGRSDVLFVVAGNMKLPASSAGALGELARRGGDLADYAAARGVAEMFCFLGHVPDPESVLAASDLVVRPSRQGDPWGRDVLEAMAFGRPVLSVGTFARFIETGVTGILHPEFDASQWADDILALVQDRDRITRLGRAAQDRVLQLCNGAARAGDLARLWQGVRKPCAA